MSDARPRFPLAAALACGLLAYGCVPLARAADTPAAAIQNDAHHFAVDVQREAHVVGQRVAGRAHHFQRQLLTARGQMSLQLHQFGHRMQRWWHRVGPG